MRIRIQLIFAIVVYNFLNLNAATTFKPEISCRGKVNLSLVDKMICQSPSLTNVEVLLNQAYLKAVSVMGPKMKVRLSKDQQAWLRERSQCKDHDCVHASLMNRLTQIDHLIKKHTSRF